MPLFKHCGCLKQTWQDNDRLLLTHLHKLFVGGNRTWRREKQWKTTIGLSLSSTVLIHSFHTNNPFYCNPPVCSGAVGKITIAMSLSSTVFNHLYWSVYSGNGRFIRTPLCSGAVGYTGVWNLHQQGRHSSPQSWWSNRQWKGCDGSGKTTFRHRRQMLWAPWDRHHHLAAYALPRYGHFIILL